MKLTPVGTSLLFRKLDSPQLFECTYFSAQIARTTVSTQPFAVYCFIALSQRPISVKSMLSVFVPNRFKIYHTFVDELRYETFGSAVVTEMNYGFCATVAPIVNLMSPDN